MKKLFILLTSLLSAGSMMGADYVKVTSAPTDWSGEYVLVGQDKDGKDYAFNGLDATGCSVVSVENKTISNYDGITISIVPVDNAYAVRVNDGDNKGKYLSSGSSAPAYTNALKFVSDSTKHIVNLAMDGENAIISQTTADGDVTIRFNYAVDQLRFRFYKSGQQPVQLYKKSEAATDTTATTTYNVNLTINGAVEGDVVMAGADSSQAVIQPAIIFQAGDNKVPAGNYVFVTAYSETDYEREAAITVNGQAVETYFGGWTSETTIDADMNIVVTFPEPAPTTADTIDIHIATPKWSDYVATQGWWQVSGYNADKSYYASLSNVGTTEVVGTYNTADMDLDFTFLYQLGATEVEIAVSEITVKVELVEGMYIFTSTIIGEDGNIYNLTFDPIDPNAIQGDDYDSPEDMEYTFAAADSVAWTMSSYKGVPYAVLRAKNAEATVAVSLNFMGDAIPAGIYPFGDTYAAGTADAGGVTSTGSVTPSYFGYLTAEGKISVPLFYCTSGSAEVSYVDDMIKVEVNAINTWQKSGHFTFYVNAHKPVPTMGSNIKLTDADFHAWTSAQPGAEIDDSKKYFESHFGEEKTDGATLYGCGTVLGTQYADLTGYDSITFFGKGTFRVLYNATADVDPKGHVEKLFTTNEDGYVTFAINNLEYFHLNVIKAPWGDAAQRLDSIILNYKPAPKLPDFKVDVTIANANVNDLTSDGVFQLSGYNADSTQMAALTIFSNKIEGTYDLATAMGQFAASQYNFVVLNAQSDTDYSFLPIQSGTLAVTKVANDTAEYYQAIGTLVSDTTCINLTLTTAPKKTNIGGGEGDTIAIHLVETKLTDFTSQMGMWQITGYSEDERFAVGVCGMSESEIAGNYDMNNIVADYTYIYDMDTDTEYAPADFTGKVEIVDGYYVLTATLTAEDGTVFALTFDPIDPNAGNPYDLQEDIEKNFSETATIEYESEDGENYASVSVENENEMFSMFFYLDSETLKEGTYEINTEYSAPSVQAGDLDDDGYIYPTFYGTLNSNGYINKLFLCTGGTVTISFKNDSILFDVNATNTWGKTGHFTFAAATESGDKPELMEVNTIANAIACAEAKVLNDNDSVAVTGYISGMFLKPTNFTKHGSVTIWLTDTVGGSAHEFELYNCYGMNGDTLATWGPNFVEIGTSNIDVEYVVGRDNTQFKIGDKIVAKGEFKLYVNSKTGEKTYELNTGCYIVEGGAPATGITTLAAEKAVKDGKYFEKDRVVIVKEGKRYNVLGTPVK